MSNTNNLGELAFTEDEFDIRWPDGAPMMSSKQERAFVEAANRILAEKLARAPHVYGNGRPPADCDNDMLQYYEWREVKDLETDTHEARLVCVKELEKPE